MTGSVAGRWPLPLGASTLYAAHSAPLTPALLDQLQRLGVAAVEIADYHDNFTYDDPAWLDQVRGWLTERGLALHSIHAHFEGRVPGSDLAAPEETTRQESLALYRRGLEALHRLGGAILVTHHIAIPEPQSQPEAHTRRRAAFVASLRELAGTAAGLGVQVAIENGGAGWRGEVPNLRALLAEAGAGDAGESGDAPPALGICLDTGHAHLRGDAADAIRQAGRALRTLHIHDNAGGRDEHQLPPTGTIDWPSVVGALRETGYAGVFLYEIGPNADVERLPESYRTLMAL